MRVNRSLSIQSRTTALCQQGAQVCRGHGQGPRLLECQCITELNFYTLCARSSSTPWSHPAAILPLLIPNKPAWTQFWNQRTFNKIPIYSHLLNKSHPQVGIPGYLSPMGVELHKLIKFPSCCLNPITEGLLGGLDLGVSRHDRGVVCPNNTREMVIENANHLILKCQHFADQLV